MTTATTEHSKHHTSSVPISGRATRRDRALAAEERVSSSFGQLDFYQQRLMAHISFLASTELRDPLVVAERSLKRLQKQFQQRHNSRELGYITEALKGTQKVREKLLATFETVPHNQSDTNSVSSRDCLENSLEDYVDELSSCKLQIEGVFPEVEATRESLEELLRTLVRHAITTSAGLEDPEIKITGAESSGYALFTITNNGKTLLNEELNFAFDPNFKPEVCDSWSEGLAACSEIVERNGGRITATNNTSGDRKQTIICFTLKIA